MSISTESTIRKVNFFKFDLESEYVNANGEKDTAVLQWSVRMGYPRVSVYLTKKKTEKVDYNKIITAPFKDFTNLNYFLKKFKEVIASSEPISREYVSKNIKWVNGVKTDEIYIQATIIVSKKENGEIYIGLKDGNKEYVEFLLTFDKKFTDILENGVPVTDKAKLSREYSMSYIEKLSVVFDKELQKDVWIKENIVSTTTTKINQESTPTPVNNIEKTTTTSDIDTSSLDEFL